MCRERERGREGGSFVSIDQRERDSVFHTTVKSMVQRVCDSVRIIVKDGGGEGRERKGDKKL